MRLLDSIKADVPNIPDEVVEIWLLPFAEKEGWPPSQNNDWDVRISGESVLFWNDAKWDKELVNVFNATFAKSHHEMMQGLFEAYVLGKSNSYSAHLGEEGERRFNNACVYAVKNRKYPKPPVFMVDEQDEFQILDGSHRFVGLLAAERAYRDFERANPQEKQEFLEKIDSSEFLCPKEEQEVWVCRPEWGNSQSAKLRGYLRKFGLAI